MADELSTKKVTALSELTAASDNDLYLTGEGGQAPLRKITFGTIAEAIKTKLLTWTFNALNTTSKTLTGAINELNGQLVTMPMPLIGNLTTEELIDAAYNDAHSNTTNQTHYRRLLNHGMAHSILGGGRYLLEGYRESAVYGWQIAISYAASTRDQPNRRFERSLINGTWSTWAKCPTRTEINELNSNYAISSYNVAAQTSTSQAVWTHTVSQAEAGTLMVVAYMALNVSNASPYNNTLYFGNAARTTRAFATNGGGSINAMIRTVSAGTTLKAEYYGNISDANVYGDVYIIKLR